MRAVPLHFACPVDVVDATRRAGIRSAESGNDRQTVTVEPLREQTAHDLHVGARIDVGMRRRQDEILRGQRAVRERRRRDQHRKRRSEERALHGATCFSAALSASGCFIGPQLGVTAGGLACRSATVAFATHFGSTIWLVSP
ncbi:MAG: hypothetical protein IAI50_02505 [Candidatus Eremiobacteraeota bacterium]|nr:hypothetical protein [Candidatus Eremiobacteraeota bacterium]